MQSKHLAQQFTTFLRACLAEREDLALASATLALMDTSVANTVPSKRKRRP